MFELATEIVNGEHASDVGLLTKLNSVKSALLTSQAVAREAEDMLALLQHNHNTLDEDLRKGFQEVLEDWKVHIEGRREKELTAVDALDEIRLTDLKG